ncbi:MAG: HAD-IA family hydrolase [Sphingomonadales bacterium]|uniref:HAD-IA family hydrolase n=1 Tax=Novosphingobium sp. NDB2Meth1 TaxID=1892847 RepID=UPI00092FF8CB|nr:HAD-IA family hydrolase [Novosphingobium sp. NDB2Meth1]MBU6395338.1 HAD-IA family hydrolase [Sphingomonadales bacterium]
MAERAFSAVIFDFGGVITSSPFEAFNRLEAERGLPQDFVRRVNATNPDDNAWARFERAEIGAAEFDALFAAEAKAQGHELAGADVLAVLAGTVRPAMVRALDQLKGAGYRIACITNNVPTGPQGLLGAGLARSEDRSDALEQIFARFEHVIESSKAGVRKPDPRIYLMMCEKLGLEPAACIYLDDLGVNCKPAAKLGMHAIKVTSGEQALADLSAQLGLPLG